MKKGVFKILALLVILVVFALVIWRKAQPTEPMYQGKPLSYWLRRYNGAADPRGPAADAIRAIGTNGIPAMLNMLRVKDSKLQSQLRLLVFKLNGKYNGDYLQNYQAALGFEVLGASTKEAVPALIQIFDEKISRSSQGAAAQALGGIGPAAAEAIPALLRAATNSSPGVAYHVLFALGGIHGSNEVVVPFLADYLSKTTVSDSWAVVQALAKYDTTETVGILVQNMTNTNPQIREQICLALGETHAGRNEATRALHEGLKDQDRSVREMAYRSTKKLDPKAAVKQSGD